MDHYDANPDYATIEVKPDYFTVYWKFINDQIEIVLQARTMSWIGIGWKPLDLDQSCKEFAKLRNSTKNKNFRKSKNSEVSNA